VTISESPKASSGSSAASSGSGSDAPKKKKARHERPIDPEKFYCVDPYDSSVTDEDERKKSCQKGKKPHSAWKGWKWDTSEPCVAHCKK
jgi:hypothetical protein